MLARSLAATCGERGIPLQDCTSTASCCPPRDHGVGFTSRGLMPDARCLMPDACRDGSSQSIACASVEMRCRTRGRIRSCPGQISRNPPCKSPDLARCDRECNVRPTQSQLQRTATGNSRAGRLVTKASVRAHKNKQRAGWGPPFLDMPACRVGRCRQPRGEKSEWKV